MRRFQGLLIVKVLFIMIINVLSVLAVNASGNFEKETIYKSNDDTKKIKIVFMSEGYSKDQMNKFVGDSKRLMNGIFENKAFSSDKDKFEVSVLKIPSNEYSFKSYIKESMIYMPNWDAPKNVLVEQVPEADLGILVLNSKEYGGRGPRDVAILTSDNADSEKVVLHEIGHSYARLADEYANTFGNDPKDAANIATDKNNVPWVNMMARKDVGVFNLPEALGYFKPALKCRMNIAWEDDYCEVCFETIKNRTKTLFEKYNPGIRSNRKTIETRSQVTEPKSTAIGNQTETKPIVANSGTIGATEVVVAPKVETTKVAAASKVAAAKVETTKVDINNVKLTEDKRENSNSNKNTNNNNNGNDFWLYFSQLLIGMFPFLKKWIA